MRSLLPIAGLLSALIAPVAGAEQGGAVAETSHEFSYADPDHENLIDPSELTSLTVFGVRYPGCSWSGDSTDQVCEVSRFSYDIAGRHLAGDATRTRIDRAPDRYQEAFGNHRNEMTGHAWPWGPQTRFDGAYPAPEPGRSAMLLAGLLVAGGAARSRRDPWERAGTWYGG